jgi:hypothetical protein
VASSRHPGRTQDQRVSAAEFAATLPGDDLIRHPELVLDRAATLGAPPQVVWPWLVQLGKGRAGWYMPSRLERVIPRARRGRRNLISEHQQLREGDFISDWGPGFPLMRATTLQPPRAIVYLSLRERAHRHRWPASEDPDAPGTLAFSWALILTDLGAGQARLHIRLRLRPAGTVASRFGGPLDYLTTQLLFAGLRERLAAVQAAST